MRALLAVLLVYTIRITIAEPTPIVLWHGMGDTCCFTFTLMAFEDILKKEIPGVYVVRLRIGNSTVEDFENGYFMNPNSQVDYVCKLLAADEKLRGGFNAIGFSQGSQFLRAVVQRCGHRIPPVKNLISLGGQHQGVYGIPNCMALKHETCDYIRKLLNYAAYVGWVQNSLVQAGYWHDPLDEDTYTAKSIFIADINNERKINKTYIRNLRKLEHFVMVKYENDTIVQPRESEWFGFYEPGQARKLLPLQQMKIYTEDRLGLKAMDKAKKLVFLSTPGNHLHMTTEWLVQNIIRPFLAKKAN